MLWNILLRTKPFLVFFNGSPPPGHSGCNTSSTFLPKLLQWVEIPTIVHHWLSHLQSFYSGIVTQKKPNSKLNFKGSRNHVVVGGINGNEGHELTLYILYNIQIVKWSLTEANPHTWQSWQEKLLKVWVGSTNKKEKIEKYISLLLL